MSAQPGLPARGASAATGWLDQGRVHAVRRLLPGTGLSAVLALAATFVSTLHGGPQFLYALFFGIAFHYLSQDAATRPGIDFCARTVLRLGVGLLGARIGVSSFSVQ